MPTLKQAVKRLRDRWILPPGGTVSVKDLNQRFQPIPSGSLRSLLLKMNMLADVAKPVGGSTHPYYRRSLPVPQNLADFASDGTHIDLTHAHMEPYGVSDPVVEANRLFDKRAAAAVHAAVGTSSSDNPPNDLVEVKFYWYETKESTFFIAPPVLIPTAKCLAAMAWSDYFPGPNGKYLRQMVSKSIFWATPGYCGSFGPDVEAFTDITGDHYDGDYDMSQMHLLQIVYRYYNELSPEAQEHLITVLLATGLIHRPRLDDIVTSGGVPNDWSRAGFISPLGHRIRIGETENHILTIHTARYLTNQLLYQRDHDPNHDNRRNGSKDAPTCMNLMLYLLRNILRDDFSEYNAKNYQTQTRYALLNLCSYAYDHEVRLAARMVLDYVSAHIAVSSNDLRRMVPFRRRNEGKNVTRNDLGFMEIGLLETTIGADPMAQHFAILAGNTRIYGRETPYHPEWTIYTGGTDGNDAVMYALSDYRLPPSIHDLFVNDLHRRFFQRLHRTLQEDKKVTGRNADNFEIYAGSPSYLITAGGSPATYAVDPDLARVFAPERVAQQLGVAVTTSFMPTTRLKPNVIPLLNCGDPSSAIDLIQFGSFADAPQVDYNYGVAPDFACGHQVNLPLWCQVAIAINRDQNPHDDYGKFEFVDRGSAGDGPGFFLAFFRYGNLAVMEAFDTWLYPEITFEVFKRTVHALNVDLMNRGLHNAVRDVYRTQNGNLIHFVISDGSSPIDFFKGYGATVLSIDYSGQDPVDSFGNASKNAGQFLHGTVMNNGPEEAVIEITNYFLGTKIRLDMNDPEHIKRTSENGEVEEAGSNHEVWVDFGWTGPSEGDFFRPFNTITAAASAVADGGVIKIMPGWTTEKPTFGKNKRIRLVAPIGNVTFGVR